ncbi:MAG: GGDEF domain-containing protein [Hydrogenophilus sp.]|nr:GGDEF domain-containing protein [Hydrogenophilus sp.]
MPSNRSPTELAKETLLQLAKRRLPPTPEYFSRMYCELAGIPEPVPERFQRLLELGWNDLIKKLIAAWELPHRDWSEEEKRRSLERVLATKHPERLFERLTRLVEAWKRAPTLEQEWNRDDEPSYLPKTGTAEDSPLAFSPPSLLEKEEPLPGQSVEAERDALTAELLHLLEVLLRNIDLLLPSDQWIKGQVQLIERLLRNKETPKLDLGALREAEARLHETLTRQATLIESRRQAEAELKTLLARFLDEMATVVERSGGYQHELAHAAEVIASARDLTEVGPLLGHLLESTRTFQSQVARSHEELKAAKAQAEAAEARVRELEAQLNEISMLVVRDPLTGVLNRRGLEEAFAREINRASHRHEPLALALIDIDNFKQINDTFGHQAGDDALKHLATMARRYLRAQDIVGRYGGEEFVVLLPATTAETAAEVIRRLQRALTRELFFAGGEQRVITFSAGVTEVMIGESIEAAQQRADGAMYAAKRAGKNRVFIAETNR